MFQRIVNIICRKIVTLLLSQNLKSKYYLLCSLFCNFRFYSRLNIQRHQELGTWEFLLKKGVKVHLHSFSLADYLVECPAML